MEDLETPTPSLKSFDLNSENNESNGHYQQPRKLKQKQKSLEQKTQQPQIITSNQVATSSDVTDFGNCQSMSSFLKRALSLKLL